MLDNTIPLSEAQRTRAEDQRPQFESITAEDLQLKEFDELVYIVDRLIVDGSVTFLAGPPKGGKSWAALNVCAAIAVGGTAFGNLQCSQGDTLYLALEDNQRRLKSRLQKLYPHDTWPHGMRLATESPRLNEGGLEKMATWVHEATNPSLIVIDVFGLVRDTSASHTSNYDADYAAVIPLKEFAKEYGVAILCIHHTRKMKADDPLETVSGTNGITGAADTSLVLQRDPGLSKGEAVLKGRGRDIPDVEMAMSFNEATCEWQHLGDASEYRASEEEQEIVDALKSFKAAVGAQEIANILPNVTAGTISQRLTRMAKRGKIVKDSYGKYRPVKPVNVSTLEALE